MIQNGLRKTHTLVELKHRCPVCNELNHKWQQVYTENNSKLDKIANAYIAWCEQDKDHILIKII